MSAVVESLEIPDEAAHCAVLVRHTKSVKTGAQETRTITPEGVQLCLDVRPEYLELYQMLTDHFGEREECRSGLIRAAITGWLIGQPKQFLEDARITLGVSLKKIQDGTWFEAQKKVGKTITELIAMVHNDPDLLKGQPYESRMAAMNSFFTEFTAENRLRVGYGHEPEPSLWVLWRELLSESKIGLAECQAYIVFTDADGKIVGITKFCPTATLQ